MKCKNRLCGRLAYYDDGYCRQCHEDAIHAALEVQRFAQKHELDEVSFPLAKEPENGPEPASPTEGG